MKKKHLLLLSMLSGILLSVAWPARGFPFFLFFAFIPLFWIEDELSEDRQKYHTYSILFYVYPAFIIWNTLTTWWIYNSTAFGVTMAVLLNSTWMSLVFLFFHWTKKRFFSQGKGYFILVFYWITFEFLHQNWDLTWSWLNLGNGFSAYPSWVQWYEYTGIFGGTFWILVCNILGYNLLQLIIKAGLRKRSKTPVIIFLSALFLPLLLSWWIYYTYTETRDGVDVVIVQPNIDPYTEQYSLPPDEVMKKMIDLADREIDTATFLLVCPESAIQENIWENEGLFEESPSIQAIHQYIRIHPGLGVIMGASTFYRFEADETVEETARYAGQYQFWYNAYNTAIYLDSSGQHQLYHKSKLVAGVERMPFPRYLKFLEKYALDLGGTIGTLGISHDRTVFTTPRENVRLGTAICYESVYGEFFSAFAKNGANLMLIITNDGWWGDSPGHRQHLQFATLRAIETRRCIARSANTGISCYVDQRGNIHQATPYWKPDVLKVTLNINNKTTFYTRYGDYFGRISAWISLLFIVSTLSLSWFPRVFRKINIPGQHGV